MRRTVPPETLQRWMKALLLGSLAAVATIAPSILARGLMANLVRLLISAIFLTFVVKAMLKINRKE
jgi:hypothetical protein